MLVPCLLLNSTPTAFCLFYDFMEVARLPQINLSWLQGRQQLRQPKSKQGQDFSNSPFRELAGTQAEQPHRSDFYLDLCSLALFASSVLFMRPV